MVFWPTTMTTPNFDVQTYARLYRYNIVAAGRPGDVIDSLGRSQNQAQACEDRVLVPQMDQSINVTVPGFCILAHTIDLDSVFLHECCGTCAPLLAALAKHPELELVLHGCGHQYGQPDAVGYRTEQAVMLLRSTSPANVSAREIMKARGVLTLREIMSLSRQGLNSLRQHATPVPNATAKDRNHVSRHNS